MVHLHWKVLGSRSRLRSPQTAMRLVSWYRVLPPRVEWNVDVMLRLKPYWHFLQGHGKVISAIHLEQHQVGTTIRFYRFWLLDHTGSILRYITAFKSQCSQQFLFPQVVADPAGFLQGTVKIEVINCRGWFQVIWNGPLIPGANAWWKICSSFSRLI